MIKNLKEFKLDLKHFHEVVVPETHLELQKKIVITLHRYIVAGSPDGAPGTPVDWNWARANWAIAIGTEAPKNDPGLRKRVPLKQDNKAALEAMKALANAKPFQILWVYNNVPYIEALEDGHSKQAPVGMVETALNSLQTVIDNL